MNFCFRSWLPGFLIVFSHFRLRLLDAGESLFEPSIYVQRRAALKGRVSQGLLLFLGHGESPMNYAANTYPFRQNSSFLYYFGIDLPNLAAVIDVEEGRAVLFGDDPSVDDIVWTGPQPTMAQLGERSGIEESRPASDLVPLLEEARKKGRRVHFLPPSRGETAVALEALLGLRRGAAALHASEELIRAVVAQRSVKAEEEVREIEAALAITREMQLLAMRTARPGRYERETAGAMHGLALSLGGALAFPIIFSVHGETLHNHHHGNLMNDGHLAVNDSGAETARHYAGDITRTFPVGGKFTERQKDIYRLVLRAQEESISAARPGVKYRDVHLGAARSLAAGLRQLGLMKGDTEEAVRRGAHALFFPHGLGHMLGLDVHDMEDLGEDLVGYDESVRRDPQFGLRSLRLGRALRPGFVLTVEPGLYFIPELIDAWKAERKHEEFIDYRTVDQYRDFGGLRIEDDILVTESGSRVLGTPIPKSIEDVEAACAR
jgi:Xaa-Pro dipeptidase